MSGREKPTYDVTDAWIVRGIDTEVLMGITKRGTLRRTSPVVLKEGNKITTENSIYNVINWHIEPNHLKDPTREL